MATTQRKGSGHLINTLPTCALKLQEDWRQQEKSVIAQPIFIFEKQRQRFKRPAEDILNEAEKYVSTLSQKRMRSSSFTDLPTFPPSGPVNKNNVFMTPTLVQRNVYMNNAEPGPVKHSEHVLRPAILQPPQAQSCEKVRKTFGYNALEPCKIKEKTNNKDTQKLIQPQLENDSHAKEKPFKSILKFPINSPNSRTDSRKNTSLIESAAAFSSQPPQKFLLEKVDVITGEEAEYNVLKASAKDTGYLHAAIHHRLVALRSFNKQKDVNQAESQSETVLQQLNCESCDEDEDEDDFTQATKNGADPSRWTHRQSVACS
ncbi:Ran-binding protein 3-like protein [Tupaia chinensis]|uniref:Ran-binding protein 3-like protein n=1 Tax=Tupaia chinensis TaxID=246437 RepID=L9JT32_TUPCH|nr:Ran-binding protein 3-like protein [Tupaia chinensis]